MLRDIRDFTVIWIVIVVLGIAGIIAGIATWAGVAPWVANTQTQINHNSQAYQDALVRQERDLVNGITISNNADQKALLTRQFCSVYSEIRSAPADLATAYSTFC